MPLERLTDEDARILALESARIAGHTCKVVHRGGTIATAEGRLYARESGRLLAHGTTTCLIKSS